MRDANSELMQSGERRYLHCPNDTRLHLVFLHARRKERKGPRGVCLFLARIERAMDRDLQIQYSPHFT